MSQYVVRPTSVISSGGGTSPSSSATVLTNLGDGSDSTVVYNTGTKAITWQFGLAAPSIPSTEFVCRAGVSLRYKGNAAGRYVIGGMVYRASDPVPAGYAALYPSDSSAFTTTQIAYVPNAWTLAEVSTLRFGWFDGRSSSAWAQTDTADIWATVYSLAKATATPSSSSETNSVFPTISVSTSATIDWEATSYDWQNLRKVTTEVRIESGGTGVGTGTLVSQTSVDTLFSATGSASLSVLMPDALANGTYKVYARALRYREDGVIRSDQYGAWSTAATLTMSAPLPATPTIAVVSDDSSNTNMISVTPVASTSYAGPFIYLERSDDSGSTWSPVRNASGVAGTFGTASTFFDYEAPRGRAVLYRANIKATYSSAFINAGLYSTPQAAFINEASWNLKAPLNSSINMINVSVVGRPNEQVEEDLGVFRPLGRKYAVVVAGTISGWDGDLTVSCSTNAEWQALKALITSQEVLFLESMFGWSKYVRLLSPTKNETFGTTTAPRRNVSLTYVEVEKPAIVTGETTPSITVPSLIDGGSSSSSFADSYDGGTATSTSLAVFDGGPA